MGMNPAALVEKCLPAIPPPEKGFEIKNEIDSLIINGVTIPLEMMKQERAWRREMIEQDGMNADEAWEDYIDYENRLIFEEVWVLPGGGTCWRSCQYCNSMPLEVERLKNNFFDEYDEMFWVEWLVEVYREEAYRLVDMQFAHGDAV